MSSDVTVTFYYQISTPKISLSVVLMAANETSSMSVEILVGKLAYINQVDLNKKHTYAYLLTVHTGVVKHSLMAHR